MNSYERSQAVFKRTYLKRMAHAPWIRVVEAIADGLLRCRESIRGGVGESL